MAKGAESLPVFSRCYVKSGCFGGKLKKPPRISVLKVKKDTGQGWLKGTTGMEAPGNELLL